MTTINIKDHVTEALQLEWPAFAARHPRLAEALDQQVLFEKVAAQLADDPDYQQAIGHAAAQHTLAAALVEMARLFVRNTLSRLFE